MGGGGFDDGGEGLGEQAEVGLGFDEEEADDEGAKNDSRVGEANVRRIL